ncbi:MAG: hypothetical protein ABI543_02830 [Ignavibacteria bacterium]
MLEQVIKKEDIGYLRLLVDILNSEIKEEKKIKNNYIIKIKN